MNPKTLQGMPANLAVNHINPLATGVWRALICLMLLVAVLYVPETLAKNVFSLPGGDLELPGVDKNGKWYTKIIYGIILVIVLLFLSIFVMGLINAIQSLFSSANDLRTQGGEKQGEALKQIGIIILCVLMSFLLMYLGWEYGVKPMMNIADS